MIEGMDRIPDPAARVARRPAPPAEAPAEPSPTRADRARLVRVAFALAIAWIVGLVALLGVRRDLATLPAAVPLAVFAVAVLAGLALVLRPRARGLPAGVRAVQIALALAPALFVVVSMASGTAGDPGPIGPCLAITGLVMLGPLGAAALVLRGSFLSAATARGAAIGALVGLSGALGAHAHCPIGALAHLLFAHAPMIVVGALTGAVLGHRWGRA